MIYKLEMNEEEVAFLIKLLANKAKEIRAWEAATHDSRRQEEYYAVTNLLKKINTSTEIE